MTAIETPEMTTTALANWFGSNRTLAPLVGKQLGKCEWVGVPFCGGCCELPYIRTRDGIACDLHRHLVNLARVVRDPDLKTLLVRSLDETLFHPDELARAQFLCLAREQASEPRLGLFRMPTAKGVVTNEAPNVEWAWAYFVSSWMGRGGGAGQKTEFSKSISFRWTSTGGGSCTRFRSAVESLDAWSEALRPWVFHVLDCFEFLGTAKDIPGNALYLDPPWPGPGDLYRHTFTEQQQRDLAKLIARFTTARVVIRFGDHPLIRELYPESKWNWIRQTSRAQSNGEVEEVLIINGPLVTP